MKTNFNFYKDVIDSNVGPQSQHLHPISSRNSFLQQQQPQSLQSPPGAVESLSSEPYSSSISVAHSSSTPNNQTSTVTTTAETATSSTKISSARNRFLDFPAIRFLLRPDFFNQLHLNDEALAQYNGSPTLKAMITRIRKEGQQHPSVTDSFERHQHNRYLVSLINKFAETNQPLPNGKKIVLLFFGLFILFYY